MKNIFKVLLLNFLFLLSFQSSVFANGTVYTTQDIEKIADGYVNNNLGLKNPAIVDVDKDGIFDILIFNDGNVAYYRNTGTIEKPFFVLENKHYDHYSVAAFFNVKFPYPVFFADKDGDGDLDLFVVKGSEYNTVTQKVEYNIGSAENTMQLDTWTLITIILVLVIVLLVLAILR